MPFLPEPSYHRTLTGQVSGIAAITWATIAFPRWAVLADLWLGLSAYRPDYRVSRWRLGQDPLRTRTGTWDMVSCQALAVLPPSGGGRWLFDDVHPAGAGSLLSIGRGAVCRMWW